MTGFGLCVNHGGNSSIGIFKKIFIDIGDQQSLENSLSTFSAHMQNISYILHQTTDNTLILLDEFGSGTEPNEGLLWRLLPWNICIKRKLSLLLPRIMVRLKILLCSMKIFKRQLYFDSATLTPKYQLLLNQVGQSNAFWIAQKMEIYPEILQNAQQHLVDKNYTTAKIERKKPQRSLKESSAQPVFQKGDRIWSQELKRESYFSIATKIMIMHKFL